jgi:tetratricopeptide (TPR) repeat protein
MNRETTSIEDLLQRSDWEKARRSIDRALAKRPDDHWLLTQLGVTYYEQQRYREALDPLRKSLAIVPDCPLTLWNLAGTLDALCRSAAAIEIYAWLLTSRNTADDDPCWESPHWAESLRTDCVYRIAVCLRHLDRRQSAERCFRQYIALRLSGAPGTYPLEEAARHLGEIRAAGGRSTAKAARDAIDATLREVGLDAPRRRRKPPELARTVEELLAT